MLSRQAIPHLLEIAHHLGSRRATQEIRAFKYADRGFGLRILPSYVRSLEIDKFRDTASLQQARPLESGDKVERDRDRPTRIIRGDAGLKTLERISYLARRFVHRCNFGPSAILNPSERDDESDEDMSYELVGGIKLKIIRVVGVQPLSDRNHVEQTLDLYSRFFRTYQGFEEIVIDDLTFDPFLIRGVPLGRSHVSA